MGDRPRRAVLYARVSTDRGEQDPEAQLVALRKWAAERGWSVVAEESDRVTSDPRRRKRDPPGLVQALQAVEERRANVLAIFAADRLVADPLPLINLVSRVQDLGGDVCSLEDGRDLDTTTEDGLLMTFLRGWYNRWRLKLNRRASIAGQQRARLEGRLPGRRRTRPPTALVRALRAGPPPRSWSQVAQELGCTVAAARRAIDQPDPNPAENGGSGSAAHRDGTA